MEQEEFTILAPNDEAFNALSDEIFASFSKPENRLKILQYHLIPGKVSQEDIDRGKITTVSGQKIVIATNQDGVTIDDAEAQHPSTAASNGVIIEINKVLLPPDF